MKFPPSVLNSLRFVPPGLEALLILLLLWQLAGLLWQVAVPGAKHGSLAMPTAVPAGRSLSPQALQDWFAPARTTGATEPVSDLQLLAVVSGTRGVAVLGTGQASSVAVRVGEEIRPGSRLMRVSASTAEIEQNGQRLELALKGQSASQPAALVVAVQPASRPAAAQTFSLTRGQLSGKMRGSNLADWSSGLSNYRDGGIMLESLAKQPLLQALQLRPGDVMKQINNRPIRQISDISLVYNQLSQQTSVELAILRDGSLQTLHYKIQP